MLCAPWACWFRAVGRPVLSDIHYELEPLSAGFIIVSLSKS